MRGTVITHLVLVLGPSVGWAQTADSLAQGTMVRVSHDCQERALASAPRQADCRRERGILIRADSAGLTWRPVSASATQVVPWAEIGGVEVSRGKRSHAGTGAAVGAVVGFIPGAVIGTAGVAGLCECSPSAPRALAGGLIVGLIFIPPGALVGAIVGELVRTERWEPVPAAALRVTVLPEPGGLGIGLALPF